MLCPNFAKQLACIAFAEDAQASRVGQLALDRRIEQAQQWYPAEYARQIDVPNDLPMRGLEQRDIALWVRPARAPPDREISKP